MSDFDHDPRHKPDLEWSKLVAEMAVDELMAGVVIKPEQAEFATRIIAQQIHITLISGCRPIADEISN